jgi:hypothetical protein
MAMFVDSGRMNSSQFHLGDNSHRELASTCLELQADGDELDAIREQFPFLMPRNNKRVIRWFGDVAKFICANLDLKINKLDLQSHVMGGDDHGNLIKA